MDMGRKKGFDERKIANIIGVLYKHPDGMWIRQIAREAGINHATVIRYIDSILRPMVEDVSLGSEKRILRIIRLKSFVIEQLQAGKNIQDIVKMLRLLSKVG